MIKFLCCMFLVISSCYATTAPLLIKDFSLSIADNAPDGDGWIETENDKYRIIAANKLREKYKVHLNNLMRTRNKVSKILKWNSWKYTDTVYDVIISEIARCFLNINGGVVTYNKFDGNILECMQDNVFIEPKNFTASNWNYLLLVNVINRSLYYKIDINEKAIDPIAEWIINARIDEQFNENDHVNRSHYDYRKYALALKKASYDIKTYMKELDLYSFLNDLRQITTRIA